MNNPAADPRRVLKLEGVPAASDSHPSQEWLVTNGIGGYASGTVAGPITRRYHGLLVAALPSPWGRLMMLHGVSERFSVPGNDIVFAGPRGFADQGDAATLTPVEFRLECGLPVWVYDVWGCRIEKRILLTYKQNTTFIQYRYLEGPGAFRVGLRLGVCFRTHEAEVAPNDEHQYVCSVSDHGHQISAGDSLPVLRVKITPPAAFTLDPQIATLNYPLEKARGYPSQGTLWSPGCLQTELEPGSAFVLTASTETWEIVEALDYESAHAAELSRRRELIQKSPSQAAEPVIPELVLAADQFLITPVGRTEDAARARAAGDEPLTVIAGYCWFTDWGRDTMISLEGLTLVTGRHEEARWILRTFAHYVRDGLIPNMFPEGEKQGLYHTADASLWFFHAISRYLDATRDRITLSAILPQLHEIANAHIGGTRFGIHVDPEDGLLAQGQEGYQLTWMDAKVGDWVVTPRRGKAVEINALWYNALCLLSNWTEQEGDSHLASTYREHRDRVRASFNQRFWNPERGYLFDVVDGQSGGGTPGNDPACRPNQVLAISLENPVLEENYWAPVIDAATKLLLTPVGLRSLAPGEPGYRNRYDGDLRARDAAYHQGSVWAWLIGPYIDALAKVYPERCKRNLLHGFVMHLDQACIGSISEIFDAEEPNVPRGCIAQAWSVAEALRCFVKLHGGASKPTESYQSTIESNTQTPARCAEAEAG